MRFARCDNRTPMELLSVPADDRLGRSVLLVIAKITYVLGGARALVAREPSRIRTRDEDDVADRDGRSSSSRYPCDVAVEKPGTDVIFVGTAVPPEPGATHADVRIQVGPVGKGVRVFGPRVFRRSALGVTPGPAAPLAPTALRYELALGGTDPGTGIVNKVNPAGCGSARNVDLLVGKPAPRVELSAEGGTAPAGLGPLGPEWSARARFAGTYDEAWKANRAPLPPLDFDPRFACVAHPDLWSAAPLGGDESVEVMGTERGRPWRFRLPRHTPSFTSSRCGVVTEHATHLDTFLVDADRGQAELLWRVRIPAPKKLQALDWIRVAAVPPFERDELERPIDSAMSVGEESLQ
jgi:hypothetical protein